MSDFGGFLLIVALLAFVVFVTWFALGFWVGGTRFDSSAAFITEVERLTNLRGSARELGLFQGLPDLSFTGEIARRSARIAYSRRQEGKAQIHVAHLSVACARGLDLTITREGVLHRLGDWLGITGDLHVGDDDFDARYRVESATPALARRAMDAGLRSYVDALFALEGIEKLSVREGWLEISGPARGLDISHYPVVLDTLARAAARAEGLAGPGERVASPEPRAARVGRVSRVAPPYVVRIERGSIRCALCHEGLVAGELDLVACERCRTVLHDECWRELGRCPIFGCASQLSARAPGVRP